MKDWNDIVSSELQEEKRKQLESETKNHFQKKINILFYTTIKEIDENLNNNFTNDKNKKIEKVEDVLAVGDTVKVRISEIDDQGKISLSMKEFETITDTEKED